MKFQTPTVALNAPAAPSVLAFAETNQLLHSPPSTLLRSFPHVIPQTPAPHIRIAGPADLSFVNNLQKRFASCLGFLPLVALEDYIARGRVKLVNENSEAAGYLLGRPQLRCQPHVMPLVHTAICMDAQRREHGRSLIEAAAAEARSNGRTIVQAWCRVDLEANNFWKSCGFIPVAIRRPKTCRGLPLILWRRPLTDDGQRRLLHIPKFAGYRSICSDPRRLLTPADAATYLRTPLAAASPATPSSQAA